jgi:acetyl-CoA synthetase
MGEIYRGSLGVAERFNIGVAACDRHADGTGRLALIYEAPDGTVERFTFDDLNGCRTAAPMRWPASGDGGRARRGAAAAAAGDRDRASRSTSSARWRCRCSYSSVPTRSRHRLADSGAKALITDTENLGKIPPGLPISDHLGRRRGCWRTHCSGRRWNMPRRILAGRYRRR